MCVCVSNCPVLLDVPAINDKIQETSLEQQKEAAPAANVASLDCRADAPDRLNVSTTTAADFEKLTMPFSCRTGRVMNKRLSLVNDFGAAAASGASGRRRQPNGFLLFLLLLLLLLPKSILLGGNDAALRR